jgi:hypothetical protein
MYLCFSSARALPMAGRDRGGRYASALYGERNIQSRSTLIEE